MDIKFKEQSMTRIALLLSVVSMLACGGEADVEVVPPPAVQEAPAAAPAEAVAAPAAPTPTAPVAAAALCTNTCDSANDGDCDDGGPNSEFNICALGTDCADCGSRTAVPVPAATEGCSNTCASANDGECDDGGPNSEYDVCGLGTDCADCGAR